MQLRNGKYYRRCGFSLAEILLTLVILGFVASMSVPLIGHSRVSKPKTDTKYHGTIECYWQELGNNNYRLRGHFADNRGNDITRDMNNACTFELPKDAESFLIQAIGAGGNSSKINNDFRVNNSIEGENFLAPNITNSIVISEGIDGEEGVESEADLIIESNDGKFKLNPARHNWANQDAISNFYSSLRRDNRIDSAKAIYLAIASIGAGGDGQAWNCGDRPDNNPHGPSHGTFEKCTESGGYPGHPYYVEIATLINENTDIQYDMQAKFFGAPDYIIFYNNTQGNQPSITINPTKSGKPAHDHIKGPDGAPKKEDINCSVLEAKNFLQIQNNNDQFELSCKDVTQYPTGGIHQSLETTRALAARKIHWNKSPGFSRLNNSKSGKVYLNGEVIAHKSPDIKTYANTLKLKTESSKAAGAGSVKTKVLTPPTQRMNITLCPTRNGSSRAFLHAVNENNLTNDNLILSADKGEDSEFEAGTHTITSRSDIPFLAEKYKTKRPTISINTNGYTSVIPDLSYIPGEGGEASFKPFVDNNENENLISGRGFKIKIGGQYENYPLEDNQNNQNVSIPEILRKVKEEEYDCLNSNGYCGSQRGSNDGTPGKPGAVIVSW